MCGAGLLFPVMSGFAKFLARVATIPCRSRGRAPSAIIVFMLAVFVPRFGSACCAPAGRSSSSLRSAMLFSSNATNFFAIIFIPLAKTASISLMAPLLVVPLAWLILGERTTAGRMVALGAGFVGVLIVIRPGTELFHWASLFAVLSAVGYAVYQVLTRRIAGIDPPETSTIYSSIVGGFGMFLVLPFVWQTPEILRDIAVLLQPRRDRRARPLSAWRAPSPMRRPTSSRRSSTCS